MRTTASLTLKAANLAVGGLLVAFLLSPDAAGAGRSRKKPVAPSTSVSPLPFATPVALPAPDPSAPLKTEIVLDRESSAFERKLGLRVSTALNESQTGLETAFQGTIMGSQRNLLQSNTQASSDLTTGESETFINGIQLDSIQFPLNWAAYEINTGIAPMQTKVNVATVPVGPLIVNVEAGFSLEAMLKAKVTPFLGIPYEESFIQVHAVPRVMSQAFVEGSVAYAIVRGGVGGEVTLADANLQAYYQVFVKKVPPIFVVSGKLEFLSGEIYGFIQYFNPARWKWKDLWRTTLYSWTGYCYKFQGDLETSGKCDIQ